MVPLAGAKPLRRVSRVCGVLTRASATRRADTAASRLACVPAPVLLSVGERGGVLVEIGLLQIVIDRIKRRALLDLVTLAHIEFDHAPGFDGAEKDHVGFDPALVAGILALVAAGQHRRQRKRRKKLQTHSRRGHVVLRSPKIRSRWTRNISVASSGACLLNRLCQITAMIAGATRICGKRAKSFCWISPREIASSIKARMPARPRETTSR